MYWKYTIVCFLAGRDQPGAAGPGARGEELEYDSVCLEPSHAGGLQRVL